MLKLGRQMKGLPESHFLKGLEGMVYSVLGHLVLEYPVKLRLMTVLRFEAPPLELKLMINLILLFHHWMLVVPKMHQVKKQMELPLVSLNLTN